LDALLLLLPTIVTGRAETLPVGAIPKKTLIATVRLDMVDRGRYSSTSEAIGACREEFVARLSPFVVIAAAGSGRPAPVVASLTGSIADNLALAALAGRDDVAACAEEGRLHHARPCSTMARSVAMLA
jgi:hypothetical protein